MVVFLATVHICSHWGHNIYTCTCISFEPSCSIHQPVFHTFSHSWHACVHNSDCHGLWQLVLLYDSHPICSRRTQGYQIFRAVRPHQKNLFTPNPGLPNFQGSKTSSQKYILNLFFSYTIYGPNVNKCAFLAIRGRGGSWVAHK